jgi:GT2 family glycosyltransferase
LTILPGWSIPGTSEGALSDCSLIIPTYERPREVVLLLRMLARLSEVPFEILVVDGSRITTGEAAIARWARSRKLPFRLTYVKSPAGLTLQRNVGIDLSAGRYVFFLDDDCIPWPGYFRAIRDAFASDGRIGAVGGLAMNEVAKPVTRRWRIRLALKLVPAIEPMRFHPCGTAVPRGLMQPFTGLRAADVLPGCCFAFSRDVLETERFSGFFSGYSQGEDLEMSLRVAKQWKVVCCGDARATHREAMGGRPASFHKGLMEVRNRYFIWRRHVAKPALLDRVRFWLDIAFLIVMDFAWFIRRPNLAVLRHAAGLVKGALLCSVRPPRYVEPPVRRQYALAS